jgi:hypothetical protein
MEDYGLVKKDELSLTASVGRHRSFMKELLAKTRSLHENTIPEKKNGPSQLAIILSHADIDRNQKVAVRYILA